MEQMDETVDISRVGKSSGYVTKLSEKLKVGYRELKLKVKVLNIFRQ
jgi:hypothetical protein